MAIGSGLSAQIGFAEESTYGTYVAPNKFYEFNSEDLQVEIGKARTRSMGDRFQRSSRIRTWVSRAGGSVEFDVLNKSFGLLFKHMFGQVSTSQPDAMNEPLHYLHTFTPDNDGLYGMYLTAQVGRPSIDGTVRPFSYLGGKVVSWDMNCAVDQNLRLGVTFDFKDATTAQTLAAQTLPTGAVPLSFIDGTLEIDGVEEKIRSFSLSGSHALATDRRFISNSKREPLANGEFTYTGQFEMEFEDLDIYNDFINGTVAELTLTFSYGEIDSGQADPFQLVVTIPALEYTGGSPTVGSSDIVSQPVQFMALDNGTDPIIKFEYHTTDATP